MIADHEECRDGALLRIERYQALAAESAALEFEDKSLTHSTNEDKPPSFYE